MRRRLIAAALAAAALLTTTAACAAFERDPVVKITETDWPDAVLEGTVNGPRPKFDGVDIRLVQAFEAGISFLDVLERRGADPFVSVNGLAIHVSSSDIEPSWDPEARVVRLALASVADDVVVALAARGVVQAETGLLPKFDHAALAIALADLVAVGTGDWRIGEDSAGVTIRDLADPGRLGHFAHVDQYDPHGDAEANSTIVSHAVYLAVERYGADRRTARDLVWDVLLNDLSSEDGFQEFRRAILARAAGLGLASAFGAAFDEVGITWTYHAGRR